MNFGEDIQMQGQNQYHQDMDRRQKVITQALLEQFKTLLLSISANKSAQVKTIVNDAQTICSMPANREVMKYFG